MSDVGKEILAAGAGCSMADALEGPFRAFASAWDPEHTADSTAPLPEMQFKHMAKFMRQAGLLEDNYTQLELLALGATVPAKHGAGSTEPSEQALPGGQTKQSSCEARPVQSPNVPSSQSLGLDAPATQ